MDLTDGRNGKIILDGRSVRKLNVFKRFFPHLKRGDILLKHVHEIIHDKFNSDLIVNTSKIPISIIIGSNNNLIII